MFDEAKRMYDKAQSHNDALSVFETQRTDKKPHPVRNWLIALGAIAFVIALIVVM